MKQLDIFTLNQITHSDKLKLLSDVKQMASELQMFHTRAYGAGYLPLCEDLQLQMMQYKKLNLVISRDYKIECPEIPNWYFEYPEILIQEGLDKYGLLSAIKRQMLYFSQNKPKFKGAYSLVDTIIENLNKLKIHASSKNII